MEQKVEFFKQKCKQYLIFVRFRLLLSLTILISAINTNCAEYDVDQGKLANNYPYFTADVSHYLVISNTHTHTATAPTTTTPDHYKSPPRLTIASSANKG